MSDIQTEYAKKGVLNAQKYLAQNLIIDKQLTKV